MTLARGKGLCGDYIEKGQTHIGKNMGQRSYEKVSVQVAMVSGVVAILIAAMYIWNDRSQLKRDNEKYILDLKAKDDSIATLQEEMRKKTDEVLRLETLLTPFRTLALQNYTGPEEEALQKLKEELIQVKSTADEAKKRLAPRSLSQDHVLKLAAQIKRHKNIQGRLEYIALDPEAKAFAQQLKAALKFGGWVFPENDTASIRPSFPTGINLYARNRPNEVLESLGLILHEFGFSVQTGKEEELPESVILIRIGKKQL